MTVSRTASDLVRSLDRHKLVFTELKVSSEGNSSIEDADWNYKDVPHLNEVHSMAKTVPALIEDDIICTVNIQKMLGIPMPIALVNYVDEDGTQVYFTTLLFFVLIVETRIKPLETREGEEVRSRADTTYRIGGPRSLKWLFPVIRRMLLANYKVLMSEDLPMREQRGRLRSVGYRFRSDGRPRTFAETTDLNILNVIPPERASDRLLSVDLSALGAPGSSLTIGNGPAGVRLVKGDDEKIMVFDRVCPHEGACLDEARVSGAVLVCPWHAKRVKPLATLSEKSEESLRVEIGSGRFLEVRGTECRSTGIA